MFDLGREDPLRQVLQEVRGLLRSVPVINTSLAPACPETDN